ncbi:MAG: DUF58 domain-containing protein [Anaerocolumna sp.]
MVGNKLGYLILVIVAGAFGILYNSYFTGILFLVVLLIPALLNGILHFTAHRITVDLELGQNTVMKGQKIEIRIRFVNKSKFPLTKVLLPIVYANEVTGIEKSKIIALSLDQKTTQKVSLKLQSDHCGNICIRMQHILLYDLLHIWRKKKKVRFHREITVLPWPSQINMDSNHKIYSHTIDTDSEKYEKDKKGDDISEVFDVRDYKPGDRPNRIHWKLSQRMNQVMMKEFSEPLKDQKALILYPHIDKKSKNRLELMDGFMEALATVSNVYIKQGKAHKMFWYNTRLGKYHDHLIDSELKNYQGMIHFLKTPVLEGHLPIIGDFNKLESIELTELLFITTTLLEDNLEHLIYQNKITKCTLIYVNDLGELSLDQDMKKKLYKYEIPFYEIDSKNVKESLENVLKGDPTSKKQVTI